MRFIFRSVLLDFQSFTEKPVFECPFAHPMILLLSYLVKNSLDRVFVICKLAMKWYLMRMCASWLCALNLTLSLQIIFIQLISLALLLISITLICISWNICIQRQEFSVLPWHAWQNEISSLCNYLGNSISIRISIKCRCLVKIFSQKNRSLRNQRQENNSFVQPCYLFYFIPGASSPY